jgi:Tol biopolymer transport system component
MRLFALLTLIVLLATGCAGSNSQETEPTGTIAFVRMRDDESKAQLWVMRADGTGQRALTQGETPAWSPDGRRIAYSGERNVGASDIFVIGFRGGGRLRLTETKYRYEEQHSPVWSPDGRKIAFQGYDDGVYWISVVDADGSREHQLTPSANQVDTGPAWSPDGRTIAFTKIYPGAVYLMRPDGGGRRVLATMKGASRSWDFAWSPDGRRIAVFSDDALWVMSANGRRPRRLVDSPFHDLNWGRSSDLAWSPDGRRIAFSQGGREGKEIFVVNADGSGLRNLTENGGVHDVNPVWSPDGRAIAFTSDRDGNSEIYVMEADGSNERNVSQNPADDFDPAWSPRG